ncbi:MULTISPECIES: immunity protein YezG family protein [Heyndrickxia]|jgi:uncharacterized protein (TIGR01741 family)|uniref:Uncharacterized protein n=2 Tax=Bacillaceae TaxID=186817 RepID=A0A133KRV8_HEYCO|nr:immunity protein YezG family protein [Weizmannia sp. CD-2023]KWZ82245.1 hypothetical protein HMPREF3213_01818 [Heyndrickxia coagulans]
MNPDMAKYMGLVVQNAFERDVIHGDAKSRRNFSPTGLLLSEFPLLTGKILGNWRKKMNTKNMENIYQQIADCLTDMIPEKWKKILLYAEVRDSYRKVYFYYYSFINKEPVYSLEIPIKFDGEDERFKKLENDLYDLFSELQSEFVRQQQDKWTHLTYILEHTGKMKVKFGYEDLSQIDPVEKQEKWEATYLK